MDNSITSAAHKEHMAAITRMLNEERWKADLMPPDEVRHYDWILVSIFADEEEKEVAWQMELSFLPVAEGDLTGASILQCFMPLANDFATLRRPELYELITKVNTKLPLVGFGFIDEFSLLYYKYNMMLPDTYTEASCRTVSEALAMITYLIPAFTDPLVLVATGQQTVKEAIDGMQFKELFS